MTTRKWLTFASAAALLAGAGACTDNTGKSRTTGATPGSTSTTSSPEGRRGENLPRARDAGTEVGTSPGGGMASPSGSQTTSGASSGSNADQTAPASGTTPGGAGQTPSNASPTDKSSEPGK